MEQNNPIKPLALKDLYNTLALDVGGVICADIWETVFLTPRTGLAAHYNLDPKMVLEKGSEIWHRFAYGDFEEEEYWSAWDETLGQGLDRNLIGEIYARNVWADKTALPLIREAFAAGMNVAIVSNSTSFWHPKLMKQAGIDEVETRLDQYLSHEVGFSKVHPQGGLQRLATAQDPEKTILVDDRKANITAARKLGMGAFHYSREEHGTLASVLKI